MVRAHIQCNSMTSLWSMVLHQMKYTYDNIKNFMHNIHNVFHIRLSLFLKQLDMNEEDILRITDELLLRRSFILETVLSFIYPGTILLILFTNIFLCSSFSIFPDLQTTKSFWCMNMFMPSSFYH
jgi:hypothetical protein